MSSNNFFKYIVITFFKYSQLLYETKEGVMMYKGSAESLSPKRYVSAHVVDTWSSLLYKEEFLRTDGMPKRMFFNTAIVVTL